MSTLMEEDKNTTNDEDIFASISRIIPDYHSGTDDSVNLAGYYKESSSSIPVKAFFTLLLSLERDPAKVYKAEYELVQAMQTFKLVQSESNITAAIEFPRKTLDPIVYEMIEI